MAAGFDFGRYLNVDPSGLGGWGQLQATIAHVRDRQQQRELEEQRLAHAKAMQQQAQAFDMQTAATQRGQTLDDFARDQRRSDAIEAAKRGAGVYRAEAGGLPDEAQAQLIEASPYGVSAARPQQAQPQPVPEETPPAPPPDDLAGLPPSRGTFRSLAVPPDEMDEVPMPPPAPVAQPTAAAPQQAQPMLSGGALQQALAEAIAQQRQQAAVTTEPEPQRAYDINVGGRLVHIDQDRFARSRQQVAGALAAPGALSSNPKMAEAATRSQQAAVTAAGVGPVGDAVKSASEARDLEARMIGSDERAAQNAAMMGIRAGKGDEVRDRMLWRSYDQKAKAITKVVGQNQELDGMLSEFESLPPERKQGAAYAVAVKLARAAGDVGALSNQDVGSYLGREFRSYWQALQSWVSSRGEGEVPQVVIDNLGAVGHAMLEANDKVMRRVQDVTMKGIRKQPWSSPEWRDSAEILINEAYGRLYDDASGALDGGGGELPGDEDVGGGLDGALQNALDALEEP